jgi:hypothetical protein
MGGHGTLSDFFMGLRANFDVTGNGPDVVAYVTADYTTLLSTITAETQSVAIPAPKTFVLTPPSGGNFTSQLQQCIQESKGAFLNGSNFYRGAAQELLIADYMVFSNAHAESSAPFTPPFAPDSDFPNPSGTDRALIETTRFSMLVRTGLTPQPGDSSPTNLKPNSPPSTTSPVDITPIIKPAPAPSTTVIKSQTYTFNPATTDFANNTATLTYSLTGLPWANLIPTSNNQVVVSGTAPKTTGTFNATLTVTDGCGAKKQLTWTVTVTTH